MVEDWEKLRQDKILGDLGRLCQKTGSGLGRIESENSEHTDNDGKSFSGNSGASTLDIEKDVKESFKKKKSAITAKRLEVERKLAQVKADEKRAQVLADERRAQVLEEEEARERERVALEMIRDLDLRKDTFTDSSKGHW